MKHHGTWIDLRAAERRLAEIDRELEHIASERALIGLVLGRTALLPANRGDAEQLAGEPFAALSRKRRAPLADLVVEALRLAPPRGLTVAEIIRRISAKHPDRVSDPRLSASISSAIGKARSTKNPRIKILKRGRKGEASRYAAI
jgi:hypothetical protein